MTSNVSVHVLSRISSADSVPVGVFTGRLEQNVRISDGGWIMRRVAKTWRRDYVSRTGESEYLDEVRFRCGGQLRYYYVQESWEVRLDFGTRLQ